MMRRALAASILLLAAAAASGGSAPEVPPVPPVVQPTDDEVKKHVEALGKAVADKNDETLAKALEDVESLRSEQFVPFIRTGLKSANSAVLAASLRAAATHELKDVEKDVRKLLKYKPPAKRDPKDLLNPGMPGQVGAAAIDYLVRLDFGGEEATVLDAFLEPLVHVAPENESRVRPAWAKDLLRASVHYLGKFKMKRAVPLLVSLVPEPKAVEEVTLKGQFPGTNPTPAYWEARVKLWQASEGWVRWALKEITGQSFGSAREWDAWLAQHKKDYAK